MASAIVHAWSVMIALVAACGRQGPAAPAPPVPTLLDVCRDSVDEPLDVACLIGRPVGERSSCEARPLTGCPGMVPPGFAMLSCRYEPGEAPPVTTGTWVRWSTGSIVDVPSSRNAPDNVIVGADRRERLQGPAIAQRFDEVVARMRALRCVVGAEDPGSTVRTVLARCGELEVDVSSLTGVASADGVTVVVGPPELQDCIWQGRGRTGPRPR